jgi:hypothetical protein
MRFFIFLFALVGGVLWWVYDPVIPHPPGMIVEEVPMQQAVEPKSWKSGQYTITSIARYIVKARVLSKEHYALGRESDLVPYDLALGWREMSDTAVLEKLSISQVQRFYQYEWKEQPPINPFTIVQTSANNHLVPADDKIRAQIAHVHVGDIVLIRGYLISVSAPDGWGWRSSITRDDSGPAACELIWVDKMDVL